MEAGGEKMSVEGLWMEVEKLEAPKDRGVGSFSQRSRGEREERWP